MIRLSAVSKTYPDGTEVLKSLDIEVNEGEFFVLIGPSGCGKTTTVKLINRLIEPTEGEILLKGREIHTYNIHELRWNIGYVLQRIALFPHMNVAENIAVVPEMKKWDKPRIRKRVDELLEMVGMDPAAFRDRMPSELSGGQQQRVGVARALAADPDLILMDEPFSALDPISRERLQQDIQNLQREIRKTVVFVTHDMDEAMALGDRVCLMKEGRVVQVDIPQNLILHPADDFVRTFIGDRRSPWLTAVDVMADADSPRIVEERDPKKRKGPLFLRDERGTFLGRLENETLDPDGPVLSNDTKLRDAVRVFRENRTDWLPVLRGDKLIGVLSHRHIVEYLERTAHTGEVKG
ncbi:osmoprotectant transport system ATP-binding protein [Melghirimyces profundicolus]|uniref:Carnitine transport ATP-binding protein OpuCA n=1 Tax=Melghirimyces profundicolus TaxID=1242148 RepID=A0A2T6BS44_9BACL|nr:ABC transporter ATP-binding protein [Melghirimyces profundicolus]PTX58898.1 osmoprotectant transport system ATP-binding protein [Melghirimyces profundicolus]